MERESAAERGKVSGVLRMRALGHLSALSAHVQRMFLLRAARLDDAALADSNAAAQEKGEVRGSVQGRWRTRPCCARGDKARGSSVGPRRARPLRGRRRALRRAARGRRRGGAADARARASRALLGGQEAVVGPSGWTRPAQEEGEEGWTGIEG